MTYFRSSAASSQLCFRATPPAGWPPAGWPRGGGVSIGTVAMALLSASRLGLGVFGVFGVALTAQEDE